MINDGWNNGNGCKPIVSRAKRVRSCTFEWNEEAKAEDNCETKWKSMREKVQLRHKLDKTVKHFTMFCSIIVPGTKWCATTAQMHKSKRKTINRHWTEPKCKRTLIFLIHLHLKWPKCAWRYPPNGCSQQFQFYALVFQFLLWLLLLLLTVPNSHWMRATFAHRFTVYFWLFLCESYRDFFFGGISRCRVCVHSTVVQRRVCALIFLLYSSFYSAHNAY